MVKLALTDFGGSHDAPLLVLLHGLLGTARNLTTVARAFTSSHHVIGLDLRNHGQSPWSDTHSYDDLAADIAETVSILDRPYDLLGHSMGGKAAMQGVLSGRLNPRKLVIADIAPVPYDHTQAHVIELLLRTDLSQFDRRAPLAKYLGAELQNPVMGQFLAQAASFNPEPHWIHNLDVLLREMDAIVGFPEITDSHFQDMLVIAGGASEYVDPAAFETVFPDAGFATVSGAGHWVHAEAPAAFNALATEYFQT